jgi:hypothetical protein
VGHAQMDSLLVKAEKLSRGLVINLNFKKNPFKKKAQQ